MTQSDSTPIAPIAERLIDFTRRGQEILAKRMANIEAAVQAAPEVKCEHHPGTVRLIDMDATAFESAKWTRPVLVYQKCCFCEREDEEKKEAQRLIRRGIPPRSVHMTLANWDPAWEPTKEKERREAYVTVCRWAKDAMRPPFLIILGTRGGTGKTALGVAALRALSRDIRALEFREWMGSLLSMEADARQRHYEALRDYYGLMIDDFGNRFIGGRDEFGGNAFERDAIASVINARFERRLPTIFTSNLDASQFAARLDDRTVDRILAGRVVIDASDWPSRRKADGI